VEHQPNPQKSYGALVNARVVCSNRIPISFFISNDGTPDKMPNNAIKDFPLEGRKVGRKMPYIVWVYQDLKQDHSPMILTLKWYYKHYPLWRCRRDVGY